MSIDKDDFLDQLLEHEYSPETQIKLWLKSKRALVDPDNAKNQIDEMLREYDFEQFSIPGFHIYRPRGQYDHVVDSLYPIQEEMMHLTGIGENMETTPVHTVLLPPVHILRPLAAVDRTGNRMIMYGDAEDMDDLLAHELTHVVFNRLYGFSRVHMLSEGAAVYFAWLRNPHSRKTDYTGKNGYADVVDLAVDDRVVGLTHTQVLEQQRITIPNPPEIYSRAYGHGGIFAKFFIQSFGLSEYKKIYSLTTWPTNEDMKTFRYQQRELLAFALHEAGYDPQEVADLFDSYVRKEIGLWKYAKLKFNLRRK